MSLSKLFKDQGEFTPAELVPRSPHPDSEWQSVKIGEQVADVDKNQPQPDETLGDDHPAGGTEADAIGADDHDLPEDQQSVTEHDPDPVTQPEPEAPPPIDIDALRKQAFQEGVEEGMHRSEADFGTVMAAVVQVSEQLNTIRETILKNSKDELIDLILALSEKIIRHSVTEQNDTIIATVEEALGQAVRSSEFVIYLNPDDVQTIKARAPEFISSVNGLENLAIKADHSVERGGCKIESENCTVDATLASQINIISKQIKEP